MTIQSNSYCQSLAARAEENRQVLVITLLSKFALVLLLGVIFAGVRLFG